MSAKHTAGPWAVLPEEVDRDYIRVRGTRLGDRYKVANVLTPTGKGVPAREADETRANARLIAAAPELLEACQALAEWDAREKDHAVDFYGRLSLCEAAFAKARAAIAKATGGAS
jgi:hypothetical protein